MLTLTGIVTAQTTWFGAPQELHPPSFNTPVRIALADVDKDGDMDLVEVIKDSLGARTPLEVRFLLGDKSGRFRESTAAFCKREIIWLEFADLDRDGDQDLLTLLLLPNSGKVGWHFAMYENDGKGRFKEHLWIHPSWGAENFVLADVDGDGDLDIHAFSAHSSQDRLFLNDGKARFKDVTGTHLPISTWGAELGIVGDFDGDKDEDLIRVDAQRSGLRTQLRWGYWENDGKGRFKDRSATHMPVQPGRTGRLWREPLDVDQDGDLDLLVLASQPYFLLNDGKGKFTSQSTLALPKVDWHGYRDATILDVDGNGLPDLLLAYEKLEGNGFIDSHNVLFLNQGKGKFQLATVSVLGEDRSGLTQALAVDLDGDGDQDLVGGQLFGLRLRFNDGKAHLKPHPGESMPHNGKTHFKGIRFSVPVDVDGDGDLDLVPSGLNRRILFNLHRQLVVVGTRGAGKPVDIEVYADAGDLAVPVLGTRRSRLRVPGIGDWYLSGPLIVLPGLSLKAQGVLGHASLRLQIPASKSLLGQPIWAQALLMGKKSGRLRFTNADNLVVRGL